MDENIQAVDVIEQRQDAVASILNAPKDEYRPYPFWCWNGKITREEITWQMEQCCSQRIRTVLIHPRHGLEVDYLSEEYFALVRHAASEARRLNMKVILYDEYNWPSGTVAGRLLRDFPQYGMRFLQYEYVEFSGPGRPAILQDTQGTDIRWIQAVELSKGNILHLQPGDSLPEGRWGVAVFRLVKPQLELDSIRGHSAVSLQQGYLDTMNNSAVRKFIELTHEVYFKHLQEFIPDVVEAIFTDEPGMIYDFDYGYDFQCSTSRSLPWTGEMEDAFRCRKGYSLRDNLIHLVSDVPGAIRTRLDYWDVATSLYTESYHEQIADWCKRHRLAYTGHTMCEEMSLQYQGDLYASMKSFTIPGVDWTSKVCSLDYPAWLSAKAISSIAHVEHRPYAMCETFGASGWGLRMNDMRRVADLLAVLGVHRLCLHSFYYTVRGVRAYECPPSEFFQNPMWEYMGDFSEYAARLGSLLSLGTPAQSVGLLLPIQSYWSRNCRNGIGSERVFMGDGDESVPNICHALAQAGVEFEFVYDSALTEAVVEKGILFWGDVQLDTLILPPVKFLKADLWQKLCTFMDGGGRVLLIGPPPTIHNARADEIVLGSCGVGEVLGEGCAAVIEDMKLYFQERLSDRRRVVECNPPAPVLTVTRQLDDGLQLVFAYNTSESPSQVILSVRGRYRVEEIDVESGQMSSCECEYQEGCTRISTQLMPYQSRMVLLSRTERCLPITIHPATTVQHKLSLGQQWDYQVTQSNVLRIKDMIYIPFTSRNGAEVFFDVICDDVMDNVFLIAEQNCIRSVSVNSRPVVHSQPCRYSDSNQVAVGLKDVLQQGRNRFRLEYTPTPQDEELSALIAYAGITKVLPHLMVVGDFGVSKDRHLTRKSDTISCGDWPKQGMPDYAGSCIYRTSFAVHEDWSDTRAVLVCDVGEGYMDVTVNDQPCGHRIWQPYELDITDALQPGVNRIEIRVSGAPTQLFTPLPGESNPSNSLAFLQRKQDEERFNGLFSAEIEFRESYCPASGSERKIPR